MRYEIILSGTSESLGFIERKPEDRPHAGDLIKIAGRLEQFKITSTIPSNNPATETVQYVVEFLSDILLLNGGSLTGFGQYYLDATLTGDDLYRGGRFRWPG